MNRNELWADSEAHQRRLEKSAIALIAVRRNLSADRGLACGIDEFLRLYKVLADLEPQQFTPIWSDPGAYFWTRRTVHFLAAMRGEPLGTVERDYCAELGVSDVREALAHHLGEFKRFALAAGVIGEIDVSFSAPYEASLPLAIAGTPYVMLGEKHARISGVRGGAIEVLNPSRRLEAAAAKSASSHELRIEACPTVTLDEISVFLNPATFRWPGVGIAAGWTELLLAFQHEHAPLVADALAAVRRFQPSALSHFAAGLHTIGLKPHDADFVNVTASELPGAFACSVPTDTYLLGGSFIHEFHHNTLFALEEQHGAFLAAGEEDEIEGENHYSPWVATLRPLHGILHAVYVFIPVFRYWSAILRDGSSDTIRLAFAREQMARIPAQLRMGINQLRRFGNLTPFAREFIDALAAEAVDVQRESAALGTTLRTPVVGITTSGRLTPLLRGGREVTVRETLLEHFDASDIYRECAAEKAEIVAA